MSQTQLANVASFAGILAILLQKMGVVIPQDNLTFIVGAVWTIGWQGYSYINRYKKGDLTLGGFRKAQGV